MRPCGVLAGAWGTPRFPTELQTKELELERKWNKGELRKKLMWLDGLSIEEKRARRVMRKWWPQRELRKCVLSFFADWTAGEDKGVDSICSDRRR